MDEGRRKGGRCGGRGRDGRGAVDVVDAVDAMDAADVMDAVDVADAGRWDRKIGVVLWSHSIEQQYQFFLTETGVK
jgi:hypothetical protein